MLHKYIRDEDKIAMLDFKSFNVKPIANVEVEHVKVLDSQKKKTGNKVIRTVKVQ